MCLIKYSFIYIYLQGEIIGRLNNSHKKTKYQGN